MWHKISGFSDYLINENGCIFRKSTGKIYTDVHSIAMKNDDGKWTSMSISKLLIELFDVYGNRIVATPLNSFDSVQFFPSIKQAAVWLIENKKAITCGRIAAYQTVRTNIKHGIDQPELYPFVYGYSWKIK